LITKDNFLTVLRDQLPQFNSDWATENIGYLIINDLARYVCSEACAYEEIEVSKAITLLDTLQKEGDSYIKDLVYECLESLTSCERYAEIKKHFTAELSAISQKVEPH
jgi:hypothetical protein